MKTVTIAEARVIADAVLAHALKNWGKNGWDMVYECKDKADMIEEIMEYGLTSKTKAITHYKRSASLWVERMANARDW